MKSAVHFNHPHMDYFSDELLEALGSWQKGWRENQNLRLSLGKTLQQAARSLPSEFRHAPEMCYRKRFIITGEYVDIFLNDNRKEEGVTSWTTDLSFAELFKGLVREDAKHVAIFCHKPNIDEVVVNFESLWQSQDFISAAEDFRRRNGVNAEALFHFRASQAEIVLNAPLRGSEVIAMVGISSQFDELCDKTGIPALERDRLLKQLREKGIHPSEPRYTYRAQAAISRAIKAFLKRR